MEAVDRNQRARSNGAKLSKCFFKLAPSDLSRQRAFPCSLHRIEAVKLLFHVRSAGARPSNEENNANPLKIAMEFL